MSPTSRYVPLNTKLSYTQWAYLNIAIKGKQKILRKLKRGMIEESLWNIEQVSYLQELKRNNLSYILGSLLNDYKFESTIQRKKD